VSTILFVIFCTVVVALLAQIAENTRPPSSPNLAPICNYEGEYRTLPGIERELARQRKRWFPDHEKIERLEKAHAWLMINVIEAGRAEQARWEAANPGMDYEHFELTGYTVNKSLTP
jgi:hypothetical protein